MTKSIENEIYKSSFFSRIRVTNYAVIIWEAMKDKIIQVEILYVSSDIYTLKKCSLLKIENDSA